MQNKNCSSSIQLDLQIFSEGYAHASSDWEDKQILFWSLIMKSATEESLVSSALERCFRLTPHTLVLVHFKQIQFSPGIFLLRRRVWQIVGDVMWIHNAALGSRQQELQVCVIGLVITLSTGTVSPNVFWFLWTRGVNTRRLMRPRSD